MKILVVGGGGREHAIIWKLCQSPRVEKIYCAPGNAGIAEIAECVETSAENIDELLEFAIKNSIDMAVIGPEVPLSMGIVDTFIEAGIACFGPDKKCSQLEASKSFTKKFLVKHGIPTAGYKEYKNKQEALKDIGIYGYPMVIKADGLAAGKGVVIAENEKDADIAIEEIMGARIFGDAGDCLVVEEFMTGIEASMLCFVDGTTIVPMESAQDYKKIYDMDQGPNTGGMGTYSPSLIYDEALEKEIREKILTPIMRGFSEDGLDYKGVLFIGLMIEDGKPRVLEFNTRFGDPETQSILFRMETDLVDIMESVIAGTLAKQEIKWKKEKAVCVVMAAGGYPGSYEKGKLISGLSEVDSDVMVFHAGTKLVNEQVVTAGGRVLGVTALGETHEEAREKAYRNIKRINFEGAQYRKDIGKLNYKNK